MNSQPPTELRYFRLPPGKKGPPVVKRFYDLAVRWEDFDRGSYNVGVSTTGLLVVDVDAHKGGLQSIDVVEMTYGELPITYTVTTPRGGKHLYFKPPHDVASSVDKLGKGIDVRGHHGYVVGAGSATEAGEYRVLVNAEIAPAPDWLVALCDKPREREARQDVTGELDTPQAMTRATAYLSDAEPAVLRSGSNNHTYKTAAAVLDFGVTKETCWSLMLDHWNERCSPPWPPEKLERVIEHAWEYRQTAVGSSDAKEFGPWTAPPSGIEPRPVDDLATQLDPPRAWLLGHTAIRGKLTVLIAPPGAGKSTLTLAMALSVAAGKDIVGMKPHEQTAAWLYNNEDDAPELRRRLHAAMLASGIDKTATAGRLYVNSGEHQPFIVAKRTGQGDTKRLRRTAQFEEAIAHIQAKGIGLFIVDPFSETHEGDENDNVEMRQVAAWFREIAQRANCAVILVHHTRKLPAGSSDGHIGNMDSGRGASSVNGVARVVQTLYGMSEKDAKRHGVPSTQRHLYVRLDDAKATLSLSQGLAQWYRRETVQVPTSDPGVTEAVGVLMPAVLTEVMEDGDMLDQTIVRALAGRKRITMTEAIDAVAADPMYQGSTDRRAVGMALKRAISSVWEIQETGATGSKGANTVCLKSDNPDTVNTSEQEMFT